MLLPSVIDRYITAELVKTFLAISLILLLITFSMLFIRALEDINVAGIGFFKVMDYVRMQVTRNFTSVLPIAYFFSIIATLTRFSTNSELIAMNASGIGVGHIYRCVLLLAIPILLLTLWMTLFVNPDYYAKIKKVRAMQLDTSVQVAGIQPGRFYELEYGRVTVYVGSIDSRHILHDIFIEDTRAPIPVVLFSKEGRNGADEESGDRIITLFNGNRYVGKSASKEYQVGHFAKAELRISDSTSNNVGTGLSTEPTLSLKPLTNREDRAELEQRLADGLAIIALTLIAIPLIDISPRKSRTVNFAFALLAYVSFFYLQQFAQSAYLNGKTPFLLGTLWYQPLIVLIVYLTMIPDSFWLRRFRKRKHAHDRPKVV